jgi:hypothetical protein
MTIWAKISERPCAERWMFFETCEAPRWSRFGLRAIPLRERIKAVRDVSAADADAGEEILKTLERFPLLANALPGIRRDLNVVVSELRRGRASLRQLMARLARSRNIGVGDLLGADTNRSVARYLRVGTYPAAEERGVESATRGAMLLPTLMQRDPL